jgi:small conductance mechanosensitive channel
MPEAIRIMIFNVLTAIVIAVAGWFAAKFIVNLARSWMTKAKIDELLVRFAANILYWTLLAVVAIAVLSSLGIDTTALIALLGAAGLAVGIALQDSMKNFASGVLLIMFRPFNLGDFVEAGGTSGIVEEITLFTTTMRTGDNREVIVPNGAIYDDVITNNSAKDTRRVDMVFGIGYEDDMRQARDIMMEILKADDRILEDPEPAIVLAELADSSVNFNVRPWVESGDYWDVKADVTEKIKLAFDDAGISIPYPQMDVHVANMGGNSGGQQQTAESA